MNQILNNIYKEDRNLWGYPQNYKGIDFYPIKLKNFEIQKFYYQLLHYPKNSIQEKRIIKMSYLKFMIYIYPTIIELEENVVLDNLKKFLKTITQIENIEFYSNTNVENFDDLVVTFKINNVEFSEYDFDVIRAIILEQNGSSIEYVEQYNPELEKYLEIANREYSDLILEDEIFIFCSLMKKTVDEIEDLTLYQFQKHFERILSYSNFELYSPLEVSGQIKSKTNEKIVKHYLFHSDNKYNRYESILIDKDKYIGKNPNLFDPNFINSQNPR